MVETGPAAGSASRWGPLFGAHAEDWAETWEGAAGWGTLAYEHVLDRAQIGAGTSVLDCGCGAGRFARMAADRGAEVAGIDAAKELVRIAALRTPDGDFRVGDLEALPWADNAVDIVTGFSAFQFADDPARGLREARRVSRDIVAVVIPSRLPESGIAAVFKPLAALFPAEALESMKRSGMFALSEPGKLEHALSVADLSAFADDEKDCAVHFENADGAVRAFLAAGPMTHAILQAGGAAVEHGVREALAAFIGADGRVELPAWFRVVLARDGRP